MRRVRSMRVKPTGKAVAVAAHVEEVVNEAWGPDHVFKSADSGWLTFSRLADHAEPSARVAVSPKGKVTVLIDGFECDEYWQPAVLAVARPRLVFVHGNEKWVHCFGLDGGAGTVAFWATSETAIDDENTLRWLQSLDDWDAQQG